MGKNLVDDMFGVGGGTWVGQCVICDEHFLSPTSPKVFLGYELPQGVYSQNNDFKISASRSKVIKSGGFRTMFLDESTDTIAVSIEALNSHDKSDNVYVPGAGIMHFVRTGRVIIQQSQTTAMAAFFGWFTAVHSALAILLYLFPSVPAVPIHFRFGPWRKQYTEALLELSEHASKTEAGSE